MPATEALDKVGDTKKLLSFLKSSGIEATRSTSISVTKGEGPTEITLAVDDSWKIKNFFEQKNIQFTPINNYTLLRVDLDQPAMEAIREIGGLRQHIDNLMEDCTKLDGIDLDGRGQPQNQDKAAERLAGIINGATTLAKKWNLEHQVRSQTVPQGGRGRANTDTESRGEEQNF
jgi:hypothetical protein